MRPGTGRGCPGGARGERETRDTGGDRGAAHRGPGPLPGRSVRPALRRGLRRRAGVDEHVRSNRGSRACCVPLISPLRPSTTRLPSERAIREGAVTKGSTTAQSLFNYERTGYTGPNRSRRDLPPMFLRVDGRGSAKDILRSGCTTTPAMGAVRRRMRTQTATPASFHFRLVRLIQVKLSK